MLLIYGFKGFLGALLVTLTCTNTGDLARVAWERTYVITWEQFTSDFMEGDS